MAYEAEQTGAGSLGQQAIEAVDSAEAHQGEEVSGSQAGDESASDPEGGEEAAEDGGGLDLESIFADEPEEAPPAEDADEDDSEEEEVAAAPKGQRANKRIRALNSKLKETSSQYDKMNAYAHNLYGSYQKLQAEMAALRRGQVQAQAKQVQKADVSDDPVEAFKAELLRDAQAQTAAMLQEPRDRVKRIEQERQQAIATQQRRMRTSKLNAAVDSVVEQEIMPYVDPEIGQELKDEYARMVMVRQATDGKGFKDAAQKVRKMMTSHARGVVRKRTKANGKRVADSQAAPSPILDGVSGAGGEVYPPWEALRNNNYKDYVQWMADGSPSLK